MSFGTLQNVKDRVGQPVYDQLTDLAGGTTPSDAVGQARLDAAGAVLIGELAKRYDAAALAAAAAADAYLAATLKTHEVSIAQWKLYVEHPLRPEPPERVQKEYDEALAWLASIVAGAALPGETPVEESAAVAGRSQAVGDPRVMKTETLGKIF